MDPIDYAGGGQLLCEQHRSRLTPPRGWDVVDRRPVVDAPEPEPTPAPVAPEDPPAPVQARAPRRRRRSWGQIDLPRLEFSGPEIQVRGAGGEAGEPDPAPAASVQEPVLVEPVGPPVADAEVTEHEPVADVEPVVASEAAEAQVAEPEPVVDVAEAAAADLEEVVHDVPDADEPEEEPADDVAGELADDQPGEPDEPSEPSEPDGPVDDLGELLSPKGGLLGRAFRATGPQRSVLTEVSREN